MVRIEWQDNSANENAFVIERRKSGEQWDPTKFPEALVVQNRTAFVDIGLKPASTYVYRVFAFGSNTQSGYSNPAGVTMPRAGTTNDKPCGDQKVLDVRFTLPGVKTPTLFSGDSRFKVDVPADVTGLTVAIRTLTPSVDVDLYVNHGSYPKMVDKSVQADHISATQTGNEVIYINSASNPPLREGTYYFAVRLFTAGREAKVNITAKLER